MAKNSLDAARKAINEIDGKMAELFVERMRACEEVAQYKKERGLAILDEKREEEVIRRNSALVEDELLREYYVNFLRNNMAVSRSYQQRLMEGMNVAYAGTEGAFAHIEASKLYPGASKTLHLCLGERGYDINIDHGLLCRAGEFFNLKRRVFIVTDDGVPQEYAKTIEMLCDNAVIITVKQGEDSKSPEVLAELHLAMLNFGMTRTDCVIAVGGGVVGDLAGFAAATYMRGIDFYNIPTTLLSQVDSSIGGKTAINVGGVKNIVGAFHQPKGVIIDLDTLNTLPRRQISNGMAEALKMSLTSNAELFEIFENNEINENLLETIVLESLKIKKYVVEKDERESGLRKILNFGHTFGHAVEAQEEMKGLYHGECVAIGMLVTTSPELKKRLIPVLEKLGLPTEYTGNTENALKFISHDKKCDGEKLSVVLVNTPGKYEIEKMSVADFENLVKERI